MGIITSCISGRCISGEVNYEKVVSTWDLLSWFKSGVEITTAGGFVDSWKDQSGNGHDFTTMSSLLIANDNFGRVCPESDASSGSEQAYVNYSSSASYPFLRSIVFKSSISDINLYICSSSTSVGYRVAIATEYRKYLRGVTGASQIVSNIVIDLNWHNIVFYIESATVAKLYLDGDLIASGNAGSEIISAMRLFKHHSVASTWKGIIADACDVENVGNIDVYIDVLNKYVKERYGI